MQIDAFQKINNIRFIIYSLIVISLLFTITNFIPLSLTFAVFAILLPLLIIRQGTWPSSLIVVTLLYAYFIILTLIYDPRAFLNYDFYRRDGNVFTTLLPIILFGLMRFSLNVDKLLTYFIYTLSVSNLFLIVISQIFGLWQDQTGRCCNFLFLTHNAAGGFITMVAVLSIALWVCTKSKIVLAMCAVNLLALSMTDSRGSVLALIGAVFTHLILKEKHVKKLVVFTFLASVALIMVTYPMWIESGRDLVWTAGGADNLQLVKLDFERSYTFFDRAIFLWPRAVYLWLHSPIIGTGFGSYNDVFNNEYHLAGIEGFIMLNFPGFYSYSDAHAHHTFFNVLAETGLIGLGLTILMLVKIRRFILNLNSPLLKHGLALMFWVAVWASMTEHRLFTPSMMLPFAIFLGITIGNERSKANLQQDLIIPTSISKAKIRPIDISSFGLRRSFR